MICPHCGTGRIDATSGACAQCGRSLADGATIEIPVFADEVEATVKRHLGRHYQIEGRLGRGGTSLVYLARELELNRHVALKVLPLQLVLGTATADRFQREAKIVAGLDHPHIVPIHRVGSTSSFLWYTMKYVKGASLAALLTERGPLPLEACLDVVGQIAGALDYAHQRGIVHRDIKPENALVDEHGWIWVCDFGIAKAFGSVPLTHTGGTLGTPEYMAPEQCYGDAVDARADQYALAILAYRCLVGAPPFTAGSIGEMIRKQCLEPPPPLAERRRDLPRHVSDALLKALSKKPDQRFSSIVEFVEALGGEASLQSRGTLRTGAPAPAVSVTAPRKRWWRHHGWKVAAGLVALAAGTVAIQIPGPALPAAASGDRDAADAPPATLETPETREPEAPPQASLGGRAAERVAAPPRPATLWVYSEPWGQLYLDDSLLGTTNLPYEGLPPGRYALRVQRDGYETLDTTVTLAAGARTTLTGIRLREVRP